MGVPPRGRHSRSLEPIGLVQQIGMVALQRCLLTGLHVLLRPWTRANSCTRHPCSADSRVTAPIPSDQVLRSLLKNRRSQQTTASLQQYAVTPELRAVASVKMRRHPPVAIRLCFVRPSPMKTPLTPARATPAQPCNIQAKDE